MSTFNRETIVLRVLKVNRLREDEDVLEQVGTTTRIYRVNSSLKSDSWSRASGKSLSKGSSLDKIEIPAAAIRYCMRKHAERKSTKGSDPRIATCRGKLQNKRSKLNQEINKELRLRAGAENLYKATTNRKLRETVALELSFVNSNLQLLKEQLAELNSSVEVYQSDSSEPVMPMIPLGLKETKEIDFREPFKDFILEHYSEDGNQYEDAISEFMDIRQAMRTPLRDNSGVSLLFEYYNQLYFVERRFFPPDRSLGIYFEWYDSLTGVPSCQRTVAFEKACVLFNAGALQTQLGAREDRGGNGRGLDRAVDCFLRAAGTFRYLHDHFTNAPSMDLSPNVLQMLVQLMLAQARECLFEKLELQSKERKLDVDLSLDLAQEAAQVSETYSKVHASISSPTVRDYVPHSWVALALVKREHYAALSHLHVALGMLEALPSVDALTPRTREVLTYIHLEETEEVGEEDEGDNITIGEESGIGEWARRRRQRKWRRQRRGATGKLGSTDSVLSINSGISRKSAQLDIRVPKDDSERKLLGRAHLREAIMFHEESERLLRMCRELRGKDALRCVLRAAHDRALDAYASAEEEDDFREILDPPRVCPSTKFQLSLTPPDFAQYRVQDLFRELGPVAIFSAKHHWTAPRNVQLRKGGGEGDADSTGDGDAGFGFSVRGDAPVIVAGVDPGSLADFGGMKEGDFIVGIGGKDVKWALHEEVVRLIKAAGRQLSLRIVTPMDRNYLKQHAKGVKNGVHGSVSPNSTTSSASSSSSSGISSGTPSSSLSSSRYNHNSPSSSSSSNASSAGSIASGRAVSKSKSSLNGEKSQLPWNPFRKAVALSIGCGGGEKKSGRHDGEDEDGDEDPNVILR